VEGSGEGVGEGAGGGLGRGEGTSSAASSSSSVPGMRTGLRVVRGGWFGRSIAGSLQAQRAYAGKECVDRAWQWQSS